MKKFYRRGDGCGLGSKICESCIEIYEPKSEVRELGDEIYELGGDICKSGDEIYEAKYEARELGDESYDLIGTAHNRICARSCGAKAAGGDV